MTEDEKRNKNLLEGIYIYGIGMFGTKILVFLIVPLYTYYISTEDMGVYDLLISTVNLLTPIVTLQISDAAYRWMIRHPDTKELYIRSTLQVLLVNSLIAAILILLFNKMLGIPYCIYFILVLLTSRSLETLQKLLRGVKNQKIYAFSGILYTAIFLLLNIIQICVLKLGMSSFFLSAITSNIMTCLVIFIFEPAMRINIIKLPDIKTIKKMLVFSAPLVMNQLNWWIMNSSDRYIVSFVLGSSANGILSIAHKFPTMLQVVIGLFTTSWQDVSIAESSQKAGDYYGQIFRKFYRFSFSFLWILVPFTHVFITLAMSSAYKVSAKYVAFYYLGTVFLGFSSFYGVGYLKNKKTNKAFSTSIYGAIVNAIVHIMLIKFIGLQAAAVSTFAGFGVMWVIRVRQNKTELKIKILYKEFIGLFISAIIICFAAILSDIKINLIMSCLGTAAFILYNRIDLYNLLSKIITRIKH